MTHELAGKPAPRALLEDVPALVADYYTWPHDPDDPDRRVSFGTSGHRGSSKDGRFTDAMIAAVTQAVVEHRAAASITGPLFLGKDTHALSTPAERTALEVLVAHGVTVLRTDGYTPTPAVSRAILAHNRGSDRRADGVVLTPSHNPPGDGGFKYDPPHGGPAESSITAAIQARANELLAEGNREVKRVPFRTAIAEARAFDFVTPYVDALAEVVDVEAIAKAGPSIGVDPMGGSGIDYWAPIAERWGIELEVVNDALDPRFAFMPLDHDGQIRMDCSSPHAMARLVALADRFDVAFGNDTDFDRHGIVCRGAGLMNPNHYLAVAVDHLFSTREWPGAAVGKTVVTSRLVDRVADALGRRLVEVPVGFKHFVDGLRDGSLGFGGEESAGASFLRRDGTVWTTDKDGILLDLLAAEIVATTGKTPAERYAELTARFGEPVYARIDAPATDAQKQALKGMSAEDVTADTLAGEPIVAKRTEAPGNGQPIGGLQVVTENGWFAARPSGTEAIYKIYAESFRGEDHLRAIQAQARELVDEVFAKAG
ncbi:MAG TPA: phosphoglucomutase (alpha-D-glucose-1,6-bisphosphate-dependent) [Sandaracinaceae bacterium LLY-WYZ-13_1]|nr:phosphoglucomutase (alpha-D-glucose-1,6-bisphosphate-dependent) [Sandaracinaceae bacterium LLY-WYZ-13_1]